jgi:tRNA-dihydrouridine synthase 1
MVDTPVQSGLRPKLHGRAFYESIGSPKYIIAPMVDASEFAWRMLARTFLPESERNSILAYSPMMHARLFAESQKYRDSHFQPLRADPASTTIPPAQIPWLDGNPAIDRPLFMQFCANDPEHLLAAAKLAAPHCDAVDLNLGCPQGIARKGHYGAFLQEDQELIYNLIKILHENLPVPVTAKIRILETREATLAYARNVLSAGASILTVHGRRREQKGHMTGIADWEYIRYLRDNLPKETVIFANGNILRHEDIEKCLAATGADGVMSAEGHLSDPAIFSKPPAVGEEGREYWRGRDGRGGWRVDAVCRRYLDILHKYALGVEPPVRRPLFMPGDDTAWLEEPKAEESGDGPPKKKRKQEGRKVIIESPNLCVVQTHLFHLLRHFVSRHHDVRDALAKARVGDMVQYEQLLEMIERKVAQGLLEYEKTDGASFELTGISITPEDEDYYDPESSEKAVKVCKRPWWCVQPIIRPVPKEALAKGAIQPKREKGQPRNKQKKNGTETQPNATTTELTEKGNGNGDVARLQREQASTDGHIENAASLKRKSEYQESELVSG